MNDAVRRLRFPWSSVAIAGIAINAAVFGYRPSGLPQLGLMVSLPVVLLGSLWAIARLGSDRRRQILTVVGFIAALPLGARAGHGIRDLDFRFRRLPHYQGLIDRVERGDIIVTEKATPIPLDANLAGAVWAQRTQAGIVRVEIFWGGGFPGKHTAYVYTSTGLPGDGARGRWSYRQLGNKWFEAVD